MKINNVFSRLLSAKKEKQELANKKRKLVRRIRYDIALIRQDFQNSVPAKQ